MDLGQSTHCGTAGIKGVGGNSLMPADLAVRLCDRRHRHFALWTTASAARRASQESGPQQVGTSILYPGVMRLPYIIGADVNTKMCFCRLDIGYLKHIKFRFLRRRPLLLAAPP